MRQRGRREERQESGAAALEPRGREPPPLPLCGRPVPPTPSRSPFGCGNRGILGHPWPDHAQIGPAKPRRPCYSRAAPAPPSSTRRSPLPRLPKVTSMSLPAVGQLRPIWAPKGTYLCRACAARLRRGITTPHHRLQLGRTRWTHGVLELCRVGNLLAAWNLDSFPVLPVPAKLPATAPEFTYSPHL